MKFEYIYIFHSDQIANFTISFFQQIGQNGKIEKDIFLFAHCAYSASLHT